MINNLAILSGFGNLSEEVDTLARSLQVKYVAYTIKPWLQLDFPPTIRRGHRTGKACCRDSPIQVFRNSKRTPEK